MATKDLKKKLRDLKIAIKSNSKDSALTDTLLNELLFVKGQLCVEPIEFALEKKDVVEKIDRDVYEYGIAKTGAYFRTKGGYFVFIPENISNAYNQILNLINLYKSNEDTQDEQLLQDLNALQDDLQILMCVPMFFVGQDLPRVVLANKAFQLVELTAKVLLQEELNDDDFDSSDYLKNVKKAFKEWYDTQSQIGLQDETTTEDSMYKENMLDIELLKESL